MCMYMYLYMYMCMFMYMYMYMRMYMYMYMYKIVCLSETLLSKITFGNLVVGHLSFWKWLQS